MGLLLAKHNELATEIESLHRKKMALEEGPESGRRCLRTVTVKNALKAVPGKKGDLCWVDVRITVKPLTPCTDTVFYITDAKAKFVTVEVAIILGGRDQGLLSNDIPVDSVFEVTNKYLTHEIRELILEDHYGI